MVYRYINSRRKEYFLHKNNAGRLFFFCEKINKKHIPIDLPIGLEVIENKRTFYPMVRRIKE